MTTLTDPPRGGFRLNQLIYDTRYRSVTIQVIVLVLLVIGVWFLINNMVENLRALGRDFSFSFLGQTAGYDIGFTLIPATSTSTHGRLVIAGLLNTLLVAFLGCVLATLIGVFVGVLRLSKNWVVSRLMAVYVEGFRNVPLLLWLVLIFALFTEGTWSPRDFKPDADGNVAASMLFGDTVAITNRGTYLPEPIIGAAGWIVIAVLVASIVGVVLLRRYARQQLFASGRVVPVLVPGLTLLIAPTLVVFSLLWLIGGASPITFDIPALRPTGIVNFEGGMNVPNSLLALWFALSLYTGAFIAEIVRSGILAVSKGQSEAAFSLGLPPGRTMSLVVLPQALRVIVPPLISQFLNLTKNSSLAIAVTYPDIRATLGGTAITTTGKELQGMLLLGAIYLGISLVISGGMNVFNASTRLKER